MSTTPKSEERYNRKVIAIVAVTILVVATIICWICAFYYRHKLEDTGPIPCNLAVPIGVSEYLRLPQIAYIDIIFGIMLCAFCVALTMVILFWHKKPTDWLFLRTALFIVCLLLLALTGWGWANVTIPDARPHCFNMTGCTLSPSTRQIDFCEYHRHLTFVVIILCTAIPALLAAMIIFTWNSEGGFDDVKQKLTTTTSHIGGDLETDTMLPYPTSLGAKVVNINLGTTSRGNGA